MEEGGGWKVLLVLLYAGAFPLRQEQSIGEHSSAQLSTARDSTRQHSTAQYRLGDSDTPTACLTWATTVVQSVAMADTTTPGPASPVPVTVSPSGMEAGPKKRPDNTSTKPLPSVGKALRAAPLYRTGGEVDPMTVP
jgi:hypothetical protein